MIAAQLLATSARMVIANSMSWFEQNREGLVIGLVVGLAIVSAMLLLRRLGLRAVERDPLGWEWRSVIGRV